MDSRSVVEPSAKAWEFDYQQAKGQRWKSTSVRWQEEMDNIEFRSKGLQLFAYTPQEDLFRY